VAGAIADQGLASSLHPCNSSLLNAFMLFKGMHQNRAFWAMVEALDRHFHPLTEQSPAFVRINHVLLSICSLIELFSDNYLGRLGVTIGILFPPVEHNPMVIRMIIKWSADNTSSPKTTVRSA